MIYIKSILLVGLVFIYVSCAYDNAEELYGEITCPEEVSFSNDVEPIINASCAIPGCHESGTQQPAFETYEQISSYADRIKTRIRNGTMPPAGAGISLEQEEIDKIACWVDAGAPNN